MGVDGDGRGRGAAVDGSIDSRNSGLPRDGYQNVYTANAGGYSASHSHSHSLAGSVSTLQPYLVTKYIIKVLPDDVQQVSIEAGDGINVKDANNSDTDTLDLFSTKIELLADTTQFKFNTGGQLQLVTPAVSQDDITSQISTAVSGLTTTVNTLRSRPKMVSLSAGSHVLSSGNRSASTLTYKLEDFTSADADFLTTEITGIIIEATAGSNNESTVTIWMTMPNGDETILIRSKNNGDGVNKGYNSSTYTLPINQGQESFNLRYSSGTNCATRIRGAIINV
jgi:hypothetical protein